MGGHRRQNSTEATAVKALQDHAAKVTDLAQRGMVAAHEAMSRNGRAMMGGRARRQDRTTSSTLLPTKNRTRSRADFVQYGCLFSRAFWQAPFYLTESLDAAFFKFREMIIRWIWLVPS